MAMRIHILAEIAIPDGTVVARAAGEDLIWNPTPLDLTVDSELAGQTAEEMAEELVGKLKRRISNWAAIEMQNREAAKEQMRRQLDDGDN